MPPSVLVRRRLMLSPPSRVRGSDRPPPPSAPLSCRRAVIETASRSRPRAPRRAGASLPVSLRPKRGRAPTIEEPTAAGRQPAAATRSIRPAHIWALRRPGSRSLPAGKGGRYRLLRPRKQGRRERVRRHRHPSARAAGCLRSMSSRPAIGRRSARTGGRPGRSRSWFGATPGNDRANELEVIGPVTLSWRSRRDRHDLDSVACNSPASICVGPPVDASKASSSSCRRAPCGVMRAASPSRSSAAPIWPPEVSSSESAPETGMAAPCSAQHPHRVGQGRADQVARHRARAQHRRRPR
jgi:hypothetical protein